VAFAKQMKKIFRDSDIFARLGGDEFVVLLTKTTMNEADHILSRFRKSIEKYDQEVNRGYNISFSYGLVEYNPETHNTIEDLLADADADAIMYTNKQQQ